MKTVDEQVETERREREKELADVRSLVKTPVGRRVLQRLFLKFGLFDNSMTGNSLTYFKLGQQNVMQFILAELRVACSRDELGQLIGDILYIDEAKEGEDG